MSNDLINEIEDAVHQEKLEKLWKEYGSYIITAAVLVVLITALYSGWNSYNTKANTADTTAIVAALDAEDNVGELSAISAELRPGHKFVAHMHAAGKLADEGKYEEAMVQYLAIASDGAIDQKYRDLAALMVARLTWGQEQSEETAQAALTMLKPIWENMKSPWRFHAHEQAAIIKANALGAYKEATEHLAVILTDEQIPPSLKERARAINHVYEIKAAEAAAQQATETKEEPEG